jgi:hypothetical protein
MTGISSGPWMRLCELARAPLARPANVGRLFVTSASSSRPSFTLSLFTTPRHSNPHIEDTIPKPQPPGTLATSMGASIDVSNA